MYLFYMPQTGVDLPAWQLILGWVPCHRLRRSQEAVIVIVPHFKGVRYTDMHVPVDLLMDTLRHTQMPHLMPY